MEKFKKQPWSKMIGTEETGEYVQIAQTALGMVGFREFKTGMFRVRIEPTEAGAETLAHASLLLPDQGWKRPGDEGQNRFSFTITAAGLRDCVRTALHALIAGGHVPICKSSAPRWAKQIVARKSLIGTVQARNVRGNNLASTWSTKTLCRKIEF